MLNDRLSEFDPRSSGNRVDPLVSSRRAMLKMSTGVYCMLGLGWDRAQQHDHQHPMSGHRASHCFPKVEVAVYVTLDYTRKS
jgi:hypothetical protein